jgi:spore coat protein A, manganese oxidase
MKTIRFFQLLASCLFVPLAIYGSVPPDGDKITQGDSKEKTDQAIQTPVSKGPCNYPTLLDGRTQPKFINRLVNVASPKFIFKRDHKEDHGIDFYKIQRKPFNANLGIYNDKNKPLCTPMFGYTSQGLEPTFPGRSFVVTSDKPIKVLWENKLVCETTQQPIPLPQFVPADLTIHTAMPMNPPYPLSGVPTVVHLHGGHTKQKSDGYPEAWATPNFAQTGPYFSKKVYRYDNGQEPTLLWYHDHTMGFTRLNNYVGLVGAYVIRGEPESTLIQTNQIPSGPYEVPLIITDKQFTTSGELFFPYCDPTNPLAPIPTVLPEFFGDFMLVNGKAWPYLNVEPRAYRFRVLNGCDSRFLDLCFAPDICATKNSNEMDKTWGPGIKFYQIGTDQGLLSRPVQISHLLIAPGQRADLVVDFSENNHQTLILTNSANAPYPMGDPTDPLSTGIVMSFNVTKKLNPKYPLSQLGATLRSKPIKRLQPTAPPRKVLLFEGTDMRDRIMPMLGTPYFGALMWHDPITETPLYGSTEIWEIYNTTMDSHPIHLHAGAFQILDRQCFDATQDPITGALTNIVMLGVPTPPLPAEEGWFDTTIAPPAMEDPMHKPLGQRTRIIMKFKLPGLYVWHCHILSHEDHDMMRPLFIRKTLSTPIPCCEHCGP